MFAKGKSSPPAPPPQKPTSGSLRVEAESLANNIDAITGYTAPQAFRVAACLERLARAMGLSDEFCTDLRLAALLRDAGVQGLQLPFLRQDRPIAFVDRLELWRHPIAGEQQAARRGYSTAVQLLVRWHHEDWNGNGYPDGLRGEQIPLGARMLRLVDTYCALTALRPFRDPYPIPEALEVIRRMVGIQFDPHIAALLIQIEEEQYQAAQLAAEEARQKAIFQPLVSTSETEIPASVEQVESVEPTEIESVEHIQPTDESPDVEPISDTHVSAITIPEPPQPEPVPMEPPQTAPDVETAPTAIPAGQPAIQDLFPSVLAETSPSTTRTWEEAEIAVPVDPTETKPEGGSIE
ncbi:MAG: HD domain-containing protein [Acidobacteria bacterium]|nr:HD domain-containing protein [Acidobacteriota bacterium]